MPNFKNSNGFKMKGFSYPGESPIRKELKGTTVFGKKVNKKNIIRGLQAIGTGGTSEVFRYVKNKISGEKTKNTKKVSKKLLKDSTKESVSKGLQKATSTKNMGFTKKKTTLTRKKRTLTNNLKTKEDNLIQKQKKRQAKNIKPFRKNI